MEGISLKQRQFGKEQGKRNAQGNKLGKGEVIYCT